MSNKTVVKAKVTSIPLADLVEDMDIYPRHSVDTIHVRNLALALEAGAVFPVLAVDAKSKRIVDGWHRARAYRRVHGPSCTVQVELVPYKTEAELRRDAVSRNAMHGKPLDAIDMTRCVLMLRQTGCTDVEIAATLNVRTERVEKLVIRVANAPKGSPNAIPGTQKIAIKQCAPQFEGKTLTKAQDEAMRSAPGTSYTLLAMQLCSAVENDMIDVGNEKLVGYLVRLRDLLVKRLPK